MQFGVACCAERDQVLLGVFPRVAAELPVVHREVRRRAARLTPLAVATQDLLA